MLLLMLSFGAKFVLHGDLATHTTVQLLYAKCELCKYHDLAHRREQYLQQDHMLYKGA